MVPQLFSIIRVYEASSHLVYGLHMNGTERIREHQDATSQCPEITN